MTTITIQKPAADAKIASPLRTLTFETGLDIKKIQDTISIDPEHAYLKLGEIFADMFKAALSKAIENPQKTVKLTRKSTKVSVTHHETESGSQAVYSIDNEDEVTFED